jgi:hypothetical protein
MKTHGRWSLCLLLSLAAMASRDVLGGSVQLLDGTSLDGDLTLDNGVMVRGEKTVRVPFASILRATFSTQKGEEFQPGLVLVNGSRLAGVFGSLAETIVKIERSPIAVPGGEIAWVVYQPFGAEMAAQIPRGKTGALLPGGDFFEGTPKGADAQTSKVLNPIFGPRIFDAQRKELHALILREIKPQPAGYEVVTSNGSIFAALDIIARDPAGISLRHPLYDGLRVAMSDLVEIRAAQTRFAALDSVKPSRVDAPTGRSAEQAFAAGKTLEGSPLQLSGKPVRGFESLAGAVISWDMPAGAVTFVTRVGAAPSTPGAQKLVFAVYADGKALARSALLGTGDAPAILRCAVPAAAKLLSLRAEGGGGSGVWGDPVVLRR